MGNPLKEVELGGSKNPEKSQSNLPGTLIESAEVPLLSEPPQNGALDGSSDVNEVQKSSLTSVVSNKEFKSSSDDLKQFEEKLDSSLDSSLATNDHPDRGDDQAPLLSKQCRSDEVNGALPPSSGAAIAADDAVVYPPEVIKEMEVKYTAYVRHDVYGNWGMREICYWEKFKLLLALVALCPIRVFLLFSCLVLFYVICKLCTYRVAASSSDEGQESFAHMTGVRRTVIVRSGRFLARAMLFIFGFYYIPVSYRTSATQNLHLGLEDSEESKESEEKKSEFVRPGAIVSNHVSYLDILYHMSASFPSFVAKRSVARLPLVGLISKCLGCVYVQREYKSSDHKGVSGVVLERLQAAHNDLKAPGLLLFPEGTTTNGDHILPFKTGAFRAKTPVQPVILKYPFNRFSPAWDTISGVRHVILLLCQFVNHLEVTHLPVYRPTEKECSDPKLYANNVRTVMAAEGNFIMSDIGLYEKRIFHNALLGKPMPVAPAPEGN
nr:lysophospholipid acyltransferase LPEAT1-like isoform X3 [Physcomitrium patens]|eukprot:XP_024389057.1 lysophospholipid acyltransferase LPEAT1-like isoform X3 [Physcomitrella patens]